MSLTTHDRLSIAQRDRLLLAYACSEWESALTHLNALRQVGCRVPEEVVSQVAGELEVFADLWNQVRGFVQSPMEVVVEARAWLTDHMKELDAVLKEVDVSDRGQATV
jgi:hypothetical protein